MQCTIPVSLVNRGMLLQELIPAFILFACAIGLALYGGLDPRKKLFGVGLLCVIGMMTSFSTAMLAFRSKIVVEEDVVTLYAGIYKANVPLSGLANAEASDQIGASLRKRTNGTSSRGVNAGWFEDPSGRKVFAISSSPGRVLLTTSGEFSLVMDKALYAELGRCGVLSPPREGP